MNAETKPSKDMAVKSAIQPPFFINAQALRAAKFCQGKNDVRYYLNGICIKKDGLVVSTNGYIGFMTQCNIAQPLQKDILINIQNAIPAKAVMAEVIFIDDYSGVIKFNSQSIGQKNTFINASYFKTIDNVKYPETEKAFKRFVAPVPTSKININSGYLSLAAKVFNNAPIITTLKGELAPLTLSTGEYNNQFDNEASMIIMPCTK